MCYMLVLDTMINQSLGKQNQQCQMMNIWLIDIMIGEVMGSVNKVNKRVFTDGLT